MLIILTSAKTMTGTSKIKAPAGTMPRFAQEANEIALNMAQFSTDDLKKILKLNPKLATGFRNSIPQRYTPYRHYWLIPEWFSRISTPKISRKMISCMQTTI